MRRRVLSLLAATALAATITTVGSSTAVAHLAWTVGPPTSGTFNFVGRAGNTSSSGAGLTCRSSIIYGDGVYGPGQLGPRILRVTNSTWDCGSGTFSFTVTHIGIWYVNAVNHTSTSTETSGTITDFAVRMSGPSCSTIVSGSANVLFTNSTAVNYATLRILPTGSTLHHSNVSGCFGLIRNGDSETLDALYLINPPSQLTITD